MYPGIRAIRPLAAALTFAIAAAAGGGMISAQQAPDDREVSGYTGLLAAAAAGDLSRLNTILAGGANPNVRDSWGRTPVMVAVHRKRYTVLAALIAARADLDALDRQKYDALTIAGVAGDLRATKMLIAAGAKTGQITSPYKGTALIATAHAGHPAVVRALISGGAPLDHVNNLGWTALIEAVVLGDGGTRYQQIVRDLVKAGAKVNLPDRNGATPLALARRRGYTKIAGILRKAGGRE